MSRVAKKPIIIPEKTEVKVEGVKVTVKGPMGEISREFRPGVDIKVENGAVLVTLKRPEDHVLVGTYASHVKNMIKGVNEGFSKKLIIEGIGYKADMKGTDIVLSLGFSHTITLPIPAGLKVVIEKSTLITVTGTDKESVTGFAAKIRSLKRTEPYKGKGIKYEGEVVKRKQGKKAA